MFELQIQYYNLCPDFTVNISNTCDNSNVNIFLLTLPLYVCQWYRGAMINTVIKSRSSEERQLTGKKIYYWALEET